MDPTKDREFLESVKRLLATDLDEHQREYFLKVIAPSLLDLARRYLDFHANQQRNY